MKKSQRLIPVLRLEQMREQESARAFSQAQIKLRAEQQKLEQLLGYHEDYRNQLALQHKSGVNIERLQSYQGFLSRLALAIKQQEAQIKLVQGQVRQSREHWFEQRNARKVMDKLIAKYRQREGLEEGRREQAELDELVQASFRRR